MARRQTKFKVSWCAVAICASPPLQHFFVTEDLKAPLRDELQSQNVTTFIFYSPTKCELRSVIRFLQAEGNTVVQQKFIGD